MQDNKWGAQTETGDNSSGPEPDESVRAFLAGYRGRPESAEDEKPSPALRSLRLWGSWRGRFFFLMMTLVVLGTLFRRLHASM